jgi:hypothetical protein
VPGRQQICISYECWKILLLLVSESFSNAHVNGTTRTSQASISCIPSEHVHAHRGRSSVRSTSTSTGTSYRASNSRQRPQYVIHRIYGSRHPCLSSSITQCRAPAAVLALLPRKPVKFQVLNPLMHNPRKAVSPRGRSK